MDLKSNKSEIVPPIRKDLKWKEVPEDKYFPYRIVDKKLNHIIKIDNRGKIITSFMTKGQTIDELKKKIYENDQQEIKDEVLEKILTIFKKYQLLDTQDHRNFVRERNKQKKILADLKTAPLLIPEDFHFTCTRCGSCCGGHNIGPINPDFMKDIKKDEYKSLLNEAGVEKNIFFKFSSEGGGEENIFICSLKNGSCIFLDDNNLCIIHKKLGEKSKPFICRLFPFHFIHTPDGIQVGIQFECRNLIEAMKGKPLREQEKDLRKLLPLVPEIPSLRGILPVRENLTISYEKYKTIENNILQLINDCPNPWECIIKVNRKIKEFIGTSDEEEQILSKSEIEKDFYNFIENFIISMQKVRNECRVEEGKIFFHTENMDNLLSTMEEIPFFAHSCFLNENDETNLRLFKFCYKNFWILKDHLNFSDIFEGQAFFALRWFLSKSFALNRSYYFLRKFYTPQDLLDSAISVNNLFRNKRVWNVLLKFKDHVKRIFFDNLQSLIENSKRIEKKREGIEIFLF